MLGTNICYLDYSSPFLYPESRYKEFSNRRRLTNDLGIIPMHTWYDGKGFPFNPEFQSYQQAIRILRNRRRKLKSKFKSLGKLWFKKNEKIYSIHPSKRTKSKYKMEQNR